MKLGEEPSREDVLEFLSEAAIYGNLGLFIGAGFSKAVVNEEHFELALSWGDLIKKAAEKLRVDYDSIQKEGLSYPEIATQVCQQHSQNESIRYGEACLKLKNTIANLTNYIPTTEQGEEFSDHLDLIGPSWIITTNYDSVIETLLTGKSISLGPHHQLSQPREVSE